MEKTKLTGQERFCRIFDFQPVDQPIRWEAPAFWSETLDNWIDLGTFPANVDPMEYYGFAPKCRVPATKVISKIPMTPAFDAGVIGRDGDLAIYQDEFGRVCRMPEADLNRRVKSTMPQWIKFPGESPKEWEENVKWRLDPATHDYGCDLEEESKKYRENPEPNGLWLCGLYAFWRNMWGTEKLSYAFFDFPDTLHDMARTWLKFVCGVSSKVLPLCRVDYLLLHEDMAYKNGPLIGPDLFRRFMLPYYKEFLQHLRNHGLKRFIVDSDGDNDLIMPCFIEAGINGFMPFEVAASNDIREIRKKYPELLIWGGLDKRTIIKGKEAVKREIMGKVPPLWESGRFIPMIDHSLMPCPQENWEYFLKLLRSLFPDR